MTQKIETFLAAEHVGMTCSQVDGNPNMKDDWARSARHFRCTFFRSRGDRRRKLTTYFSMGSAHIGNPKAADVLDCLASDAAGIENARHFEDWCAEYGYDTDSRQAEKTYNVCRKQARQLAHFFGDRSYEELLWETERQ